MKRVVISFWFLLSSWRWLYTHDEALMDIIYQHYYLRQISNMYFFIIFN
ncbi:hypothetical protein KP509_30G073700 [Ceratopteris richardii]|uniref:Uncharacterized protein n=1 Tax=Ceratopteris richardii TaxID=49495 RepID=A0A8T2R608_CERRI|nr:hypothetical protein KP509_30G073700 [Ceratopteris richardii]